MRPYLVPAALLLSLCLSPLAAQTPPLPANTPVNAPADAPTAADLNLGGYPVLRLHGAAGGLTPEQRINVILSRVTPLLGDPVILPSDVVVYLPPPKSRTNRYPVIYALGRRLITVDPATVKAAGGGRTPLQVATLWAARLQQVPAARQLAAFQCPRAEDPRPPAAPRDHRLRPRRRRQRHSDAARQGHPESARPAAGRPDGGRAGGHAHGPAATPGEPTRRLRPGRGHGGLNADGGRLARPRRDDIALHHRPGRGSGQCRGACPAGRVLGQKPARRPDAARARYPCASHSRPGGGRTSCGGRMMLSAMPPRPYIPNP